MIYTTSCEAVMISITVLQQREVSERPRVLQLVE